MTQAATRTRKTNYPGKVAIRHAVETARDLGLDVAGFEVRPDGTIKIIDRAAAAAEPKDEWEEWDRAGKLG